MKPAVIASFICALFYASLIRAESAAWYLWRSPHNATFICSQIAPGDDWNAFKGPFQDAMCKKLGAPPRN